MTPPTDPSYTAQALRTESPITPALQTRLKDHARLVHAVLGLQTEAGELADPVKKHIYYGRPLDVVNLREEIGDCLWYLAIAADALGTTLAAEQARNLAKLRARYPHVFTAEAAQVRDLDREREMLEVDLAEDPATLRQNIDAARAETVETRKRLNEETDRHRATNAEKIELFEQKEWANKHNAELRGKLDAAIAAVALQRAGIERLQAFVETVREAVNLRSDVGLVPVLNRVMAALAELDAGTEPAPVADPARCPECERLRAVIDQAWQRIQQSISHADVAGLLSALAEIQSNSSATLTSSVVKESLSTEPEGGQ